MTIDNGSVEKRGDSPTDETTRVVRATSLPTRASPSVSPPTDQHRSVTTTAELPTYRPTATALPGGASRYAAPRPPGRARRREPAPIALRIVVWLFAFVCLLAVITLVISRARPSWISFLRNPPGAVAVPPTPNTPGSSSSTSGFALVSTTPTTVTYDVPAKSFSIVVTPIADAYLTVKSPPSSTTFAYASVIHSHKSATVSVSASAAVVVAAKASSIQITSGGTVLGQVSSPKVNVTYLFQNAQG